ncbi:DUF3592 domain-containing protein [Anaerosporobacter sp.]|uniref:DUF3592 domain-containing protein n=1 Tax=Anaerosporobacter sp. TaxID=1872529 RepID=UPI00286F30C8|nr:hypothetical protein [Anaerosporobacter sp.]
MSKKLTGDKFPIVVGSVFIIVGIILAIFAMGVYISNENYKNKTVKTESIISNVRSLECVDVTFVVNGTEYEGTIDHLEVYSTGGRGGKSKYIHRKVGQKIIIYCNPDNPSEFRRCSNFLPFVFGVMGLGFILIGVVARKVFLNSNMPSKDGKNKFYAKKKVLKDATSVLNKPNQSWYVTIKGNSIVAGWNWKMGIKRMEEDEFVYSVTLKDDGRWKEDSDKTGKKIKHSGEKEIEDIVEIKQAVRYYLRDCGWRKMQ